jgi:hypothetical protein
LLIDLDLGEVGVVGEVERGAAPDPPLDVDTRLGVVLGVGVAGARALRQVADQERHHTESPRRRQVVEAGELAGHRDAVHGVAAEIAVIADRARQRRPVHLLVLAPDHPPDVQAPGIALRVEAHGRERDRQLGGPPRGVTAARGVPHPVPVHVDVATLVGHQRVEARAVGVGLERVAVAVIAEGVEHEHHGVVAVERRVALHLLGDHALGLGVESVDREVEHAARIDDAHLGALGGGRSFVRLALRELAGGFGALPGRLFELAVDRDRLGDRERRQSRLHVFSARWCSHRRDRDGDREQGRGGGGRRAGEQS